MLELLSHYLKLNELDKQGMALMKTELEHAEWLALLGSDAEKEEYFNSYIKPLRKKIMDIGKQEVQYAEQLREKGIPLPSDIAK